MSYCQTKLNELYKLGFSILIFDYNGYGQSRGIPSQDNCFRSAEIFVSFLFKNGYTSKTIIPYGEDIGACVASYVAVKYRTDFLILESPVPCIRDCLSIFVKPIYPFLNDFNTNKLIEKFEGKLLLIHSMNNKIIPIQLVNKIFNKAFKTIQCQGDHCFPTNFDWKEINKFLSQ